MNEAEFNLKFLQSNYIDLEKNIEKIWHLYLIYQEIEEMEQKKDKGYKNFLAGIENKETLKSVSWFLIDKLLDSYDTLSDLNRDFEKIMKDIYNK